MRFKLAILLTFVILLSLSCVFALGGDRAIYLLRLSSSEPLVSENPDRPMIPASTTKVVTAYLALRELGPYYYFSMRLYKLRGEEVYLITSDMPWLIEEVTGDPLSYLKELLRDVPDNSTLLIYLGDFPRWHRDWDESFKGEAFAPFITQLAFNENSFRITLSLEDSRVRVREVYPPLRVELRNSLRISSYDYWATKVSYYRGKWKLNLWGPVAFSSGGSSEPSLKWIWAPISDEGDLALFNRDVIQEVLRDLDRREVYVKVVRTLNLDSSWELLREVNSPPLISILRQGIYWSDNFIAENVLRYLVYLNYKVSIGSSKLTDDLEVKYLKGKLREMKERWGLKGDLSTLTDGCGLSKENRLTARFLVALLGEAYKSPIFPYFLEVLPSKGEGTLSDRLGDLSNCLVKAKTGTLNGVSSLAGFLYVNGNWFAFAIISNNTEVYGAKRWEDGFIKGICEKLSR